MASERLEALHRQLEALHRQLEEETGRLLGWEAGQEVAARDRETRIRHLEQLAADGLREVARLGGEVARLATELERTKAELATISATSRRLGAPSSSATGRTAPLGSTSPPLPMPTTKSLRRDPTAPSRPGATSRRLGAPSSSATGRTAPLGSTSPPLPMPTTKSGRRMFSFSDSLTPRRPADQADKRKGDSDGIFDVTSSDASPSETVALSPQRAARLGPVTPDNTGRPQLVNSRARSRLCLKRGQPTTPKTPQDN